MSIRTVLSVVVLAAAAVPLMTPSARASTPGTVQVSGNRLAAALVRPSALGPGYKAIGPPVTSGGQLESMAFQTVAGLTCQRFWSEYDSIGLGETAFAFTIDHNARPRYYRQAIFQFANTHAAGTFFAAERSKFRSCRSFTLSPAKLYVRLKQFSDTRVGGHRAFLIAWSETIAPNGTAGLVPYILVTIDGADVFMVQVLDVTNTLPGNPSPATVIRKQIAGVSSLR